MKVESTLAHADNRTVQLGFVRGPTPLSFGAVFAKLAEDSDFRVQFVSVLKGVSFDAFFFETPAHTLSTLGQPFECVLVDGPSLAGLSQSDRPFKEHFERSESAVICFKNLSGDAELIVPTPAGTSMCYAHLASFLRHGPEGQIDEFWKLVGEKILNSVSERPVWLSTAGLGVSWLHLRIDTRPKYYRHTPYKAHPRG